MVGALWFLASDASGFVNGVVLLMDGGFLPSDGRERGVIRRALTFL